VTTALRSTHDAVNEHIRAQVSNLALEEFGWDGHGALPARPEVVDYLLNDLFRHRTGWAKAGDVGQPGIALLVDGTFAFTWQIGGRFLRLRIPTRHVVIAEKCDRSEGGNTSVSVRLGEDPLEDADDMARMFRWLNEED
jgi:hypothetical protein